MNNDGWKIQTEIYPQPVEFVVKLKESRCFGCVWGRPDMPEDIKIRVQVLASSKTRIQCIEDKSYFCRPAYEWQVANGVWNK